jgi:nitrous-oxide reductase
VALNKWSVDRHPAIGTLHPQNFQLIDIDGPELRDPEGHADRVRRAALRADDRGRPSGRPVDRLPGRDRSADDGRLAVAIAAGEERIERDGDTLHVYMTARAARSPPTSSGPSRASGGDAHHQHRDGRDATHGFAIPGYNIQASLDPGEVVTIEFTADRTGSFAFYCTEFCSALHLEMQGWLLVEP